MEVDVWTAGQEKVVGPCWLKLLIDVMAAPVVGIVVAAALVIGDVSSLADDS